MWYFPMSLWVVCWRPLAVFGLQMLRPDLCLHVHMAFSLYVFTSSSLWACLSVSKFHLCIFKFFKYFNFFLFIEFIGVTLANKIIQASGAQFYNTSSVYCAVCSPSQVKSPSITIYPPIPFSTSLHLFFGAQFPFL